MSDDNVIELGKRREPRFSVIVTTSKTCAHDAGCIVDGKTRTVECKLCKEEINPFDALISFADSREKLRREWDMAKQDLAIIRGEIDRAIKDRNNIRRQKDGKAVVVEVDGFAYSDRPDAGIHLGREVIENVRAGKAVLFVPKAKT